MPKIPCGSVIRRLGVTDDPGTAGCLVQFPDDPEKLFWLTAGHVLVGRTVKQFDPVEAKDLPGRTIGVLYGWTSLGGPTTTDAAIVQVDPEMVLPEIDTLGAVKGINVVPQVGAKLTIFAMGEKRSGTIEKIGVDMPIRMVGPDFEQPITYLNQIKCDAFDVPGAAALSQLTKPGMLSAWWLPETAPPSRSLRRSMRSCRMPIGAMARRLRSGRAFRPQQRLPYP